MQRGYSNSAFQPEEEETRHRKPDRDEDRYRHRGVRVGPQEDVRNLSTRGEGNFLERRSGGIRPRDREPYDKGWGYPEHEGRRDERSHWDMPRRDQRAHTGAQYHALRGGQDDYRNRAEPREHSGQGTGLRQPEMERRHEPSWDEDYELQEVAQRRNSHEGRHYQGGRGEVLERDKRHRGSAYNRDRLCGYEEYPGQSPHQSYLPAFRGCDEVDSRYPEVGDELGWGATQRESGEYWAALQQMLPSQMDKSKGTLRFRGTLRGSVRSKHSSQEASQETEELPTTEEEVVEALHTLREQPWHMANRRRRRVELTRMLNQKPKSWYYTGSSIVQQGSNSVKSFLHSVDPLQRVLKRIEGRHGTSVVAVFNFLREMIQLNVLLFLLLLGGIIIPASIFVKDDGDIQGYGWNVSDTSDMCLGIDMTNYDNKIANCNTNYTADLGHEADGNFVNIVGDFLQGTGYLEWTFLFSGRYPAYVESDSYNISLAYILTMLVVYFISLVYVAYFVAKFLRKPSASAMDYGMTFSNIIFTGWDFTVTQENAVEIERNLTLCEVRTAFDDADYKKKQLSLTRRDRITLYLTRTIINLVTVLLIGGGWVAIYFLVIEAEDHRDEENNFTKFLWEYAPTMLVSAFNFIYPLLFDFVVGFEHYTGRTALLITLGRCVLVRLTSLGILVITTLGVIYSNERSCDAGDEYICWETQIGKQVYSVLVLDMLIQIGMTFVVDLLRRGLYNFDNALCKKVGRMEFYVPGHVLDVVYMQTLCWIGILYAPLLSGVGLIAFCVMFLLKLFTVTVTCFPATRVFRASRSSAMFMTILAIAFFMCVVSTGMGLLLIQPSYACSPFRGLEYAWQAVTYNVCQMTGSSDSWLRIVIFSLDDMGVAVVLFVVVILLATYYISLVKARGSLIRRLENKLKITTKEKNFLMKEYNRVSGGA